MRPLPLLFAISLGLALACTADPKCGPGTHEEDGACAPDEEADTDADSDADTDTDADSDTDSDTDTDADTDVEPDTLDVRTPWTGDASCVDGVTQTVNASCRGEITPPGVAVDFQTGDPASEVEVALFASDDPSGSYDQATANTDGRFDLTVPTCAPVTMETATPPKWEETVDTYQQHRVYAPSDASRPNEVYSFSFTTARLIPALIGVSWDDGTALLMGTALGCDQEPMENVEIVVVDAAGALVEEGFYFSESGGTRLPTDRASQPATNTNGLWLALNVPPGAVTVQMWGWDGVSHVLLGAAEVSAVRGSVTIADVHVGIDDGIYYPEECLSSCE